MKNFCTEPVPSPVSPSPMKKTWSSTGDNELKDVPITVKSSAVGAGPDGPPAAINTPTRYPAPGPFIPEMLPDPVLEDEDTAAKFPSASFWLLPVPILSEMQPAEEPQALVSDPVTLENVM